MAKKFLLMSVVLVCVLVLTSSEANARIVVRGLKRASCTTESCVTPSCTTGTCPAKQTTNCTTGTCPTKQTTNCVTGMCPAQDRTTCAVRNWEKSIVRGDNCCRRDYYQPRRCFRGPFGRTWCW